MFKIEHHLKDFSDKFSHRFRNLNKKRMINYIENHAKDHGMKSYLIKNSKDKPTNNLLIGNRNSSIIITSHIDTPSLSLFYNTHFNTLFGHSNVLIKNIAGTLLFSLPIVILYFLLPLKEVITIAAILLMVILYFMLTPNSKNKNNNDCGVATSLELMRLISISPYANKVLFVFTDMKMMNNRGAKIVNDYFSKNFLTNTKKKIINLEYLSCKDPMILFGETTQLSKSLKQEFDSNEIVISQQSYPKNIFFDSQVFKNFYNITIASGVKSTLTSHYYFTNSGTGKDREYDANALDQLSRTLYKIIINGKLDF